MNVRPLHDRIVVQRLEEGEQKVGGIIIPDTAQEKPQQGTVNAVGNRKMKDDRERILDIEARDRILFGKYAGQEIKLDGEEYLIMKEDDVVSGTSVTKRDSVGEPQDGQKAQPDVGGRVRRWHLNRSFACRPQ